MRELDKTPDALSWNSVARNVGAEQLSVLWREWSDNLNAKLTRQLLPSRCFRLLKTDAFDESITGGLYSSLAEIADSVILLDISSTVLHGAAGNHCALMTQADVRQLPFAKASFDAVVSLSTLDHFRSAQEIDIGLGEIARILKPGGILAITLDNRGNPLIGLRNRLPFGLLTLTRLVPYFVGATLTHKELARALTRAGFTKLEESAVGHFPRVVAVLLCKVAERLGGRNLIWRLLWAFEALGSAPTRYLTGHYIAVRAVRAQ